MESEFILFDKINPDPTRSKWHKNKNIDGIKKNLTPFQIKPEKKN